jgi:hypothetical protein
MPVVRVVVLLLLAMGGMASSVKHRHLLRALQCGYDCYCSGVISGSTVCGAPCPPCPGEPFRAFLKGKPKLDTDIKGHDLDGSAIYHCSKSASGSDLPFCKVCGSLDAVVQACIDRNKATFSWSYQRQIWCWAITYDHATKCGYLKTSTSSNTSSYRKGWITVPVVNATMTKAPNTDIKGSDIACNGQPFCKVCGSIEAVGSACFSRGPACQAFTYQPQAKCGYLKVSKKPASPREGWDMLTVKL